MVVHAFSLSTWEAEAGNLCEFEASLVYRANSRTARATHREILSKKEKKKNCLVAGEMAQWLRALVALVKDSDSMAANNCP